MENGAEELAKLQEERSEKSEKGSQSKEQGAYGGGNLYSPLPSLEDLCLASTDTEESESSTETDIEERPSRRKRRERDKNRRRKSSERERNMINKSNEGPTGYMPAVAPPPSAPPPSAPPPYTFPPTGSYQPGSGHGCMPCAPEMWREVKRELQPSTSIAFPVYADQQQDRYHQPLDFKTVKSLAESVRTYGVNAPFTLAQIEALTTSAMAPNDWANLARACLNPGQYLDWKSFQAEFAGQEAANNARNGQVAWNQEMLLGTGRFADIQNQTGYPVQVYEQINRVAVRAWKSLPNRGEVSGNLTKIIQGAAEPFSDFVARMMEAAGRMFGDAETAMPLVKQLIYEQSTKECRAAITPYRQKPLEVWMKACRELGGPLSNAGLAAAVMQLTQGQRDTIRFAFTVPSCNHEEPDKRFEWVVLPQGMANSPTMCQLFVGKALEQLRQECPSVRFLHYMDDILIAAKTEQMVQEAYSKVQNALRLSGLQIAPEKVQQQQIADYLGTRITPTIITPQKLTIRADSLKTLNDFQKLLGDINWIRGFLKLPNYELQPLYEILKGDPALDSPRQLTQEARQALHIVEQRLSTAELTRISEGSLWLCILNTYRQPTGVLWQKGPLLWIHPRVSPGKIIEHYPTAVALLAEAGLQQTLQFFGCYPSTLVVPYNAEQISILCATIDEWAILRCIFPGKLDNHYPASPLMTFFKHHPIIFPKITSSDPIIQAVNIYTDGSKTGVGAFMVQGQPVHQKQFTPGSPQVTELQIVIEVFKQCSFAFNLISDSLYVVGALKILEVAGPIKASSTIASLFVQLQELIRARDQPFYPCHIRAHSGLPGPLAEGNAIVDAATRPFYTLCAQGALTAKEFHEQFHVNAKTLQQKFKISRQEARQIVLDCNNCAQFQAQPSFGVNPRGLAPLKIWQMDVTHISEFGTLKYVHVSVDTYSGVIHASAQAGEKGRNVIAHCLDAWAAWGKPQQLKTDNGPAYAGQLFEAFCNQMGVRLNHGLPYNPQGQGIVERAHRTLKECLLKQKGGIGHGRTPKERLSLALFVMATMNFNKL
ncbi:hypothetical protein STEG23_026889 [Scotinomys teguina]